MVDQQPISSPEVNEGIFFSEVNAANHFLPELQDVNISFERQISREIKQLSTQAGGSREARRQLVNEALHQVRRAGREYGFQKGRHWLPPENEPFNALVKFNSQISRLFESTPDVAQLYDDLKALYSSYVELGTAQRRYGDKLASILYTSLRGIDVNFGEILSTLNRLEPEERAEIITHCYQERHGRTFISDLEKSYHNPIRRIFHWWGDRNSNDEVAEIKALLGFDLQAKVDAKAYQLCRAVSTKRGVNTEMLASAYRTLPSEWREKVEQRFCAWRGIDPNGFASYVVGQAKNSEKSLVQTIIGPDGNQLAKVDASFLFASVNGWRSNLQKLSESMGEMPKNHLQRVVQELDLLLSETSFGSFAGWLDKNIQKLHRNSFFDRVYYLTQAATEDNCHGAYWKAEAARFQAALARSSKEFLAAVFLEKSPVERKLVLAAYEEIYQSVLLEEAKKRQYGLSPLAQRLLEYAVDPSKDDDRMLLKKSGIPLALMFADVYEGLGTHELGLFELLNSLTQKELTKVAADFNAELTYSIAQRASVEVFAGVSKVFYSQRWGGLPHQELESNMPNLGGRNLVRETFAELDGTHLVTAMQLLYGNDRPNRHKVRDLEQLVLIARSPKMAWYVDWYTREGKALDRDLVLLKDYFERVSTLQFLTPEQQEHFDFLEESVRTSLDSYGKSAKNTAFQSANWLAIGAVTVATYACASIGTGLLSGFLIAGTIGACMTLAARVSVSRLINGESHGRESFLWDAGLALIDGYTLKIGFLARYLGPLTRSFIGPVAVRFINSPLGRKCTASIVKGSIKFLARNRILATLASSENKESQYVNYVYQMVSEERRNQYRSQASKIAEQILLYG